MPPEMSATIVKCAQIRVSTSTWIKRVGIVLLGVVIMTLGLIAPQLVQAESHVAGPLAQWVVNTAVDENDGSCSDGDCSLRDAIAVAANGDNITFSGNYTIYLNSQLRITKTLTVDGSGHTIKVSGDTGGDGSPDVRVFFIGSGSVVTLTHLNIVSGVGTWYENSYYGGGIYIYYGNVNLQDSTVSGNDAYDCGGGIYTAGVSRLSVQNSTFSGNSARWGGGICNAGSLTMQNSTISNNFGTLYGGGIANVTGASLVQNSTFISNRAGTGGGIDVQGSVTVQNSTFYSNTASDGGGIYIYYGSIIVQNSTLSGNAAAHQGGGVYNRESAGNTLNLSNVLIADSSSGGDCVGSVNSNDHNLIEDNGNACGLVNGVNGNVIGADPVLAPLANYGGATQILALLPGSPAFNAGNNATCLTTDQRDVFRPQDGTCDIGAFESRGFNLTYIGGSGQNTLGYYSFPNPIRLTINNGYGEPIDGGQVILTGPASGAGLYPAVYTSTISGGAVTQTIWANATTGIYVVSADMRGNLGSAINFILTNLTPRMVMLGNGIIILGGDTTPSLDDHTDFGSTATEITRTFTISNPSSTASLTITGFSLSGSAAGDFAFSGLSIPLVLSPSTTRTFQVRFSPVDWGIRAATVTLTNSVTPGNPYNFAIQGTSWRRIVINANNSGFGSLRQAITDAPDGGTITFADDYAIYLNSTLTITKRLIIDGSDRTITVSGDSSGNGSRDVRVFYIDSSGVVTLTHLNIVSGTTSAYGGGILNGGTLIVQNITLAGNSALAGGGIYNEGKLTVQNSTFTGNSAIWDGGGINNEYGSTLTLQNCTLSGNSADSTGGGAFNGGTLTVQNSTFSGNSASGGGGIGNGGTLYTRNNTLSSNSADVGGGIFDYYGDLHLSHTLIANSPSGGDCYVMSGLYDEGHNLIEDEYNSCLLTNGEGGNIVGVDPLLAPLGNYGGGTQTFALLLGSPALDAGGWCPDTDQRGVTRPQGAACDIGAYEREVLITKRVSPAVAVPYHGLVTYTLALVNIGPNFDAAGTITDALPVGVNFGSWVENQGAVVVDNVITWTGTLTNNGVITLAFTAIHTGGYGDVLTNTVYFSGTRRTDAATARLVVVAPEMAVLGNNTEIVDGDTTPSADDDTDFGSAIVGQPLTRTFIISNSGSAPLHLTGTPVINLSGDGAANFNVVAQPETSLGPDAITIFQISFTPAVVGPQPATVSIANDDNDENPYTFTIQGTGLCTDRQSVTNSNDSGSGSLRQAIANVCDGGTVDFAANQTIYLSSTLDLNHRLTIDGTGHAIKLSGDSLGDGTPDVQVLFIGSSGIVTLTHLTIVSGTASSDVSGYVGGGIRNAGWLALQEITLAGNSAPNYGGGIYNESGTLSIQSSTFSGNSAAYYGSGLYNESGTLSIQSSTFSNNSGGLGGSGIYNHGLLTIQNSTFSSNSTAFYGGGVFNEGTLTIQNSTFSGNSSDSGGGIYNDNTLTLQNNTFSGNSGFSGGGVYNSGTLNLFNTLIANSLSGGDCRTGSGSLATNDHNLMQSTLVTDTCGLINGAGGSLIGVDPQLGPLANNGGDTQTFSLLPGSPALDAGNNATCLATDQRGIARPQGMACDIGAYEFAGLSLTKLVTPSAHVLAHNIVTYTLLLGFGQDAVPADPNIILTDTLPEQGLFNTWVISPANTVQSGNTITWTGALTAGQAITFTFTATYLGSSSQWITNTAAFSGTNWTGSAAAGFQVAHLITPTTSTGGHITPNTPQIIDHGESITFTISPDYGYHILNVGVDGISVGAVNVYTFTHVVADHTISATFALNEYTLAVGTNGQGQVTRAPDRTTYPHRSVVTLTATPAQGWYFGQWLGDASGTLTQTTVLMDANKIVTATFFSTPQTYYTLTLDLIGSGVITPTAGSHSYLSGATVGLEESPAPGWQFVGWSGDVDCADGSVMMNVDKLCTATFARYQLYLPLVLRQQ